MIQNWGISANLEENDEKSVNIFHSVSLLPYLCPLSFSLLFFYPSSFRLYSFLYFLVSTFPSLSDSFSNPLFIFSSLFLSFFLLSLNARLPQHSQLNRSFPHCHSLRYQPVITKSISRQRYARHISTVCFTWNVTWHGGISDGLFKT